MLWLQEWQHQDEPFRDSFHRVCPDYVLLDDLWLNYYEVINLEPDFLDNPNYPENFYPMYPDEPERLNALLSREYEVVERMQVDENTLTFWRRQAPDCPQPGELS